MILGFFDPLLRRLGMVMEDLRVFDFRRPKSARLLPRQPFQQQRAHDRIGAPWT